MFNQDCTTTTNNYVLWLSVREDVVRYGASDATEEPDCYSDGDRSNAPQIPVASYSDLLFSFATVEGNN